MKLTFDYDFEPKRVLHDKEYPTYLKQLKRVGVSAVWLDCYCYGHWFDTPEDTALAKKRLEEEGFTVHALNVPLGHGGPALDPVYPFDPSVGEGWQNRTGRDGVVQTNTTCVDEKVIADTRAANEIIRQIGFTKLFHDDDLRLAHWGPELHGCYCPRCIRRFTDAFPKYSGITREEIVRRADNDPELWHDWEEVQCNTLTRFLRETIPEGIDPGIMVMHNGDRRHGIDVSKILEAFPNAFFRVGEGHFCDDHYLYPEGKEAIARSIKSQMHLIGDVDRAYSETTAYPLGTLSPENWVDKMRLEISCGLRHLFLMSGTGFFYPEYWDALEAALPSLREQAEVTPIPDYSHPEPVIWHL